MYKSIEIVAWHHTFGTHIIWRAYMSGASRWNVINSIWIGVMHRLFSVLTRLNILVYLILPRHNCSNSNLFACSSWFKSIKCLVFIMLWHSIRLEIISSSPVFRFPFCRFDIFAPKKCARLFYSVELDWCVGACVSVYLSLEWISISFICFMPHAMRTRTFPSACPRICHENRLTA